MQELRRWLKTTLLVSTLVAAAVAPQATFVSDAKAQSAEKRRVAVGAFDGNKSRDAREAFLQALQADGSYDVTDSADVKAGNAEAMTEAAKGLNVHAVITGKVSRSGAKLKVFNGADGAVLEEVEVKGAGSAKLKASLAKSGASSVASAIAAATVVEEKAPEPPPEEAPAEESTEEAPATESGGDGATVYSPLDLSAGLRPMHRRFEFKNTLADLRPNQGFRRMLSYELPLGPVLFIDANWYPGSHFSSGLAELFGITAGFEKGVAIETVFNEGEPGERTLKTNETQWYAGGRFRLPFATHQLGVTATYGQHTFELTGDEVRFENGVQVSGPLVPDVKYGYARLGVDGLFRFGDFLVSARLGKRFVLGTGALETATWFPNAKASSLEAGGSVGYRLVSTLDLVVGFDWLRYAFDFNPVATPPAGSEWFAAGGAVDQYYTGHIALRFHIPGASETASE
jgi:hypothetical protein